jgi:hypothetical protein
MGMEGVSHKLPGNHKAMVIKNEVANLREIQPLLIEHVKLMAEVTRAKYLALLDNGFTKEEALMLCK